MIRTELAGETYAVIDVETTGFDPTEHRVVEIACMLHRDGTKIEEFSTLVNPGRPIPPETTAIHGITDGDVLYAPPLQDIEQRLRTMTSGAVLVAHNAPFDMAFLPFLADRPVICSMRLAMHLVDATSFKIRALCETLGCGIRVETEPAHHAAADARVTADVFAALLRLYTVSENEQSISGLIETIGKPALLRRFTFGDHRGEPIASVPTEYLRSILEGSSDAWPDVRYTSEVELALRAATAAA